MKNRIKILIVLVSLVLISCSKWLDVTPPSQIREEAQFNSVEGFQQALMGCYLGMTDDLLYGRTLSWGTIELMGGQFEDLQSSSNNDYQISNYNYESDNGQKYVNGIWSKAYNVIANANNALKYIDINKDQLDNINYSIIKGELLALRAYIHFDLMRIYGYGNLANRADIASKFTIPYVTSLDKEMTPQQTYVNTINYIISDLKEAIELLEIDPVTGVQDDSFYSDVNIDGFYNNRQQRFNYYATSLLLARVYMWEGSEQSISKAATLASELIIGAQGNNMVTWANSNSVTEDPLMKSEHLFSLNTQNLYIKTANYFMLNISAASDIYAQYISSDNLLEIYEAQGVGATDYRFSRLFQQNNVTQDGKNSYTPIKYYGVVNESNTKNYIPLMRISEAYYIAAEALLRTSTPNVEQATTLLNEVRSHRGIIGELSGLSANELMEEIMKEYHKEFYCEGVMFFLYKRLGLENIPRYSDVAGDNIYVMPYPITEIQMGREQ